MHYASFLLYAPLLSGQRVSGKIKFAAAADWQVSVLQLLQPVSIVQCNIQLFLIQSRRTRELQTKHTVPNSRVLQHLWPSYVRTSSHWVRAAFTSHANVRKQQNRPEQRACEKNAWLDRVLNKLEKYRWKTGEEHIWGSGSSLLCLHATRQFSYVMTYGALKNLQEILHWFRHQTNIIMSDLSEWY